MQSAPPQPRGAEQVESPGGPSSNPGPIAYLTLAELDAAVVTPGQAVLEAVLTSTQPAHASPDAAPGIPEGTAPGSGDDREPAQPAVRCRHPMCYFRVHRDPTVSRGFGCKRGRNAFPSGGTQLVPPAHGWRCERTECVQP